MEAQELLAANKILFHTVRQEDATLAIDDDDDKVNL